MRVMVGNLEPATRTRAPFSFGRNIAPPLLGVIIMALSLGVMNGQWITAQLQYRFMQRPAVQAMAPTGKVDPNAPPTITINKINVSAPIVTNIDSYKEGDIKKGLENGVLHYWRTAEPGQNGNIVLFGHSSGQLWAPGNYKFVFTLLDKLKTDDLIQVEYQGTRYFYRVTGSKVVLPTDFSVVQPTNQAQLTLITCTPVGTSKNRLVVYAKQVSPDPKLNQPAASNANPVGTTTLPSN